MRRRLPLNSGNFKLTIETLRFIQTPIEEGYLKHVTIGMNETRILKL